MSIIPGNRVSERPSMLTVRSQLRRLVLVVIGAVVLLMSGAFFVFEYISYRNDTVSRIYPVAATLGIHLRPALAVPNRALAQEILATSAESEDIVAIYLFDQHNRPFSYYKSTRPFVRAGSGESPDNLLSREDVAAILADNVRSYRFAKNNLAVFVPIWQETQKLGTLYLVLSLNPLYQRILWWFACAIPIVGMAVAIGTFLASRLQHGIVDPVSRLVGHMERVTAGDLRSPAEIPASGELGKLVEGFNAMLGRIAVHERMLEEINASLEERVRSRTADLARSEAKYRSLFEDSPVSMWEQDFSAVAAELRRLQQSGVVDLRSHLRQHPEEIRRLASMVRVLDVNRQTVLAYGAGNKDELLGQFEGLLDDSALSSFAERLVAVAEGRTRHHFEAVNRRLGSGEELYFSIHWSVVPGHEESYGRVLVSLLDITERRRTEQALIASLREKEVLIREVNHRVKNNLQVISSLIRLQLKQVRDPRAAEEMQSALNRIRSIALVHERLYQSSETITDLRLFLADLAKELCAIYGVSQERVQVTVDLHGASLSFDMVTSLVLIVNELLTNSLKHAFIPGAPGHIAVNLELGTARLQLSVQDDGIGLPPGWSPQRNASLGLTLVDSLAAQIGGSVDYSSTDGTRITVTCPLAI